jgi:hypothetical protein
MLESFLSQKALKLYLESPSSHHWACAGMEEMGPQEIGWLARQGTLLICCRDIWQKPISDRDLYWGFQNVKELPFTDLESSRSLSPKGKLSSFHFLLPLSINQYREFHSGALVQGWRSECTFPLPFLLSLSSSQHRKARVSIWLYP